MNPLIFSKDFKEAKQYLDLLFEVPLSLSDKSQLARLVRKHEEIVNGIKEWTQRYPPARQAVVEFIIINYPLIGEIEATRPILQGYWDHRLNNRLKEYRDSSDIVSASFF